MIVQKKLVVLVAGNRSAVKQQSQQAHCENRPNDPQGWHDRRNLHFCLPGGVSQEVPDTERVRISRARGVGGAYGKNYSPPMLDCPEFSPLFLGFRASHPGKSFEENRHDGYRPTESLGLRSPWGAGRAQRL